MVTLTVYTPNDNPSNRETKSKSNNTNTNNTNTNIGWHLCEKQNQFYRCIILRNDRLRQLRDLRLRTFVFCLHNFLAFIAFLAHFLFCLRTFSYARPCVRCVHLNGNRA